MGGRGSSNQAWDAALKAQLQRWQDDGDQVAHRAAYEALSKRLFAPSFVIEALGNGVIEEVRQDVLFELLGRRLSDLCGATSPRAYAQRAYRNRLLKVLKKWGNRRDPRPEVRDRIEQVFNRPPPDSTWRLDAAKVSRIAESLDGKGRLAVLLTTRPDRISQHDWELIVSAHPPPPPRRPREALDPEEASLLMYPPEPPESEDARRQRRNTFDKLYRRALASIRQAMESSS